MPIFTTTISQQNTAGSAGVYNYPQFSQLKQYSIVSEDFTRETLNPTNAIAFYSVTNGQGSGVPVMNSFIQLQIPTTATTNDSTDVRTSGIAFERQTYLDLNRTTLTFNIWFLPDTGTNQKGFIGLSPSTGLTAIPTTALNLGIYWDTSVDNNYHFTSGNGSAQVTKDTGLAVNFTPNTTLLLQIIWNGDNSATMSLFTTNNSSIPSSTTLKSSQTVTSFLASSGLFAVQLHWFIQTLTTAIKIVYVRGWQVSAT